MGCPIRKSRYQGLFAPKPGLSQLITSFIASESLGIHRSPFFAFLFALNYTSSFALLYAFVTLYNFCEIVYAIKKYLFLTRKKFTLFCTSCQGSIVSFYWNVVWRIRSRTALCGPLSVGGLVISIKGLGLERGASRRGEVPFLRKRLHFWSSPRQSWTADLYIISVAL